MPSRFGRSEPEVSAGLLRDVRRCSRRLRVPSDLDPVIEAIGGARYVLLGEASHGTHEFYTWRAALTERLITEHGFSFVAVEGDWPDCYRIDQYVKGQVDEAKIARDVLRHFSRWPTWMWANQEVATFISWLHEYNVARPQQNRIGFYGLDVYSLWDSLYRVGAYLRARHPDLLPAAQHALQCFSHYGEDVQEYARATRWLDQSCEDEVLELLREVQRTSAGRLAESRIFDAEQNALVVKNAEHYYRTMIRGGPESWNIRDRHMVQTLERLVTLHGDQSRAVVWEHNTHVGDARFTDMAQDGMVSVGQLVRERHRDEGACVVGFSSYKGTVIAGREWEAQMEVMTAPPGRSGSWEDVLHRALGEDALLLLKDPQENEDAVQERGHRAIGVVYHPHREAFGNYVPTVLPRRYDALLYIDESQALRPLDIEVDREGRELPETYPSGV